MLPTPLNMLQPIPLRLRIPHPRTTPLRPLPRPARLQIVIPERPRPALHRPHLINPAPRPPPLIPHQKNTIIIPLLNQRIPLPHLPHIRPRKIIKPQPQMLRHPLHILNRQPHIPRRPPAAMPTLRTLKTQPPRIPHPLINHRRHPTHRQRHRPRLHITHHTPKRTQTPRLTTQTSDQTPDRPDRQGPRGDLGPW